MQRSTHSKLVFIVIIFFLICFSFYVSPFMLFKKKCFSFYRKSMRLKVNVLDLEQCQSQTFSWFHKFVRKWLENFWPLSDHIWQEIYEKEEKQDRAEIKKSLQIILSNLTRGLGNASYHKSSGPTLFLGSFLLQVWSWWHQNA